MKLTLDIPEELLSQQGEQTIREQIDALLERLERQAATDAIDIPLAVQQKVLKRLAELDPTKCKPAVEVMASIRKRLQ